MRGFRVPAQAVPPQFSARPLPEASSIDFTDNRTQRTLGVHNTLPQASAPGKNHGGVRGGAFGSPPSWRKATRMMSAILRRRSRRNSSYSIDPIPMEGRAPRIGGPTDRRRCVSFWRRRGTYSAGPRPPISLFSCQPTSARLAIWLTRRRSRDNRFDQSVHRARQRYPLLRRTCSQTHKPMAPHGYLVFFARARLISSSTRAAISSRSLGSGGAPACSSVWLCPSM